MSLQSFIQEYLFQAYYLLLNSIFFLYLFTLLIHLTRSFFVHLVLRTNLQTSHETLWSVYLIIRDFSFLLTLISSLLLIIPGFIFHSHYIINIFTYSSVFLLSISFIVKMFGKSEVSPFSFKLYHAFLLSGFILYVLGFQQWFSI